MCVSSLLPALYDLEMASSYVNPISQFPPMFREILRSKPDPSMILSHHFSSHIGHRIYTVTVYKTYVALAQT